MISCHHTALLATVVFLLVQIAICKCHTKSSPGGTGKRGREREGEEEVYMKRWVHGDEGSVVVIIGSNNPTYMEIGD